MFEFSLKLNAQIYTFQHFNTKPRLAILALLRCVAHDFACHFGIKCSSFSKVNRGTSRRSACDPIGFCEYHSVRIGNILLERTGFERLNMDRIFISIISTHVNQFEFICPSIRNCLFCRTSLLVLLNHRAWRSVDFGAAVGVGPRILSYLARSHVQHLSLRGWSCCLFLRILILCNWIGFEHFWTMMFSHG